MHKWSLLSKHLCLTQEKSKCSYWGILLYKLLEKRMLPLQKSAVVPGDRDALRATCRWQHAVNEGSHGGTKKIHPGGGLGGYAEASALVFCQKKHSHTCLNTASFQQRGKGFQAAQLCYCNHTAQAKLDRVALFSRIRFYKLHSNGAPLRCYAEVSGIVSITNKSLCPKFMLDGNLASKA